MNENQTVSNIHRTMTTVVTAMVSTVEVTTASAMTVVVTEMTTMAAV